MHLSSSSLKLGSIFQERIPGSAALVTTHLNHKMHTATTRPEQTPHPYKSYLQGDTAAVITVWTNGGQDNEEVFPSNSLRDAVLERVGSPKQQPHQHGPISWAEGLRPFPFPKKKLC